MRVRFLKLEPIYLSNYRFYWLKNKSLRLEVRKAKVAMLSISKNMGQTQAEKILKIMRQKQRT